MIYPQTNKTANQMDEKFERPRSEYSEGVEYAA